MCYDEVIEERGGAMKFTSFVRSLPTKEKIPFIASLSVMCLFVLGLIAYGIFILVGIIWLDNYKIEFYSPPFGETATGDFLKEIEYLRDTLGYTISSGTNSAGFYYATKG